MTRDDLSRIVATCLEQVVPEAEASTLDPAGNLRDQLDIDSMDMLRFLRALHDATSVDIPETDARRLETLDGAREYLAERLGV